MFSTHLRPKARVHHPSSDDATHAALVVNIPQLYDSRHAHCTGCGSKYAASDLRTAATHAAGFCDA